MPGTRSPGVISHPNLKIISIEKWGKVSFKYNFFQIPACGDTFLEEELNSFLESKAVVDLRQEFAQGEGGPHWCFSVRWRDGALTKDAPKRAKALVDYKEILSPADFVTFARLREVRKELAKAEQVPAYAIFTNEQLAEIAKAFFLFLPMHFLRSKG